MRTIEKLSRYKERLRSYYVAKLRNDPLVSKPTREEFQLTSQTDLWSVKQIEDELRKEFKDAKD